MPKQRGLREKTCAHCSASYMGRKVSKYCSISCGAFARAAPAPNNGSFKPAQKSWNTGLSISGMSGKTHALEAKEKMRKSSSGEKGTNWKGGITDESYRIRRSGMYADWRAEVFKRDNYTCQCCGLRSEKGSRVRLNADHIKPFAFFPDLRFELSNGRTLCEPCHRRTPTWGAQKDFTGQQATLESTGQAFGELKAERVAA